MIKCIYCNNEVDELSVALTKKLINRGSVNFLCLDCLANKFSVDKKLLIEKSIEFKKSGCTLFLNINLENK